MVYCKCKMKKGSNKFNTVTATAGSIANRQHNFNRRNGRNDNDCHNMNPIDLYCFDCGSPSGSPASSAGVRPQQEDSNMEWETESIKQVLMRRDDMSAEAADELIAEAKVQLQEYLADGELGFAEDICAEYFGLEPDYIYELM